MSYKNRANFKPLSNFIKRVNVKNKDGAVANLKGINIDKFFMPSVANVIGTDLTKYKVVKPQQFACNRMHVGRDYRLPIAVSNFKNNIIVSPAYDVFEIINTNELNPEYLMMWFSRSEFDRNCWFYTDTDVRGKLGWDSFCEIELPIPSIEKQKEIVKEYNTVISRIKLNEQFNQKLEETAQALYKHWFVDFEFPNAEGKPYKSSGGEMVFNEELDSEIPLGWEVKSINYFSEIGSSKRVFRSEYRNQGVPFYRGKEISIKKSGKPIEDILYISTERYVELKSKYGKPSKGDILLTAVGTIGSSYLVEDEEFYFKDGNVIWFKNFKKDFYNNFIYAFMQSKNFNEVIDNITIGSTQSAITMNALGNQLIIKPSEKAVKGFSILYSKIHDNISIKNILNIELYFLKSIILSKMSKVEVEKEMV